MTVYLHFEWNPEKARSNLAKHSVTFDEAASVFRDPAMLTLYDVEHSADEDRWITLGLSDRGRLLVVCHTYREESGPSATIRLFSSRKARKREFEQYKE